MSNRGRDYKISDQTAAFISAALDRMVEELPAGAAPQMAIERVITTLAVRQPWFMRLIMEDPDIREAYAAAVASIPIKLPGSKASPN